MAERRSEKSSPLDAERCLRWAREHGLPAQREASKLVRVGEDGLGRPLQMTPLCAERWHRMRGAAEADGVALLLVSAFRSVEQQREIFERKLERGDALEDILCVNAAPGFSEHHSGRALDLGAPGCVELSEAFEATPAFSWLRENAGRFGFELSYPRDNPYGIVYEPWHWAARDEG